MIWLGFAELPKYHRRYRINLLRNRTDLTLVSQDIPSRVSCRHCRAGPRLMYEPTVLFISFMIFSFSGLAALLSIVQGKPMYE